MVSLPATIAFFSIAGVILISIAAMFWRTHRKNKLQALKDDHVDVEGCFVMDKDIGEERVPKHRLRGWRWKKILIKVGWIQIPSHAEDEHDDQEEMQDYRRRQAVVEEQADQAVVGASSSVIDHGFGARPRTSMANRFPTLTRPTYVAPFENFGGYKLGDYEYGPDNLSALPVVPPPIHRSDLNHRSQRIVEIMGSSDCSSSPPDSPMPTSNKSSIDPGSCFSLTSYNGCLSPSQDEMTAALPIPKDHPLCQHHPSEHNPTICQLPKPTGERNLAAFQYERESLVPTPLDPHKGKHSPDAERSSNKNQSQDGSLKRDRETVAGEESIQSYRDRRRSRGLPSSDGGSSRRSVSRYSHFENPLGQHPVEVEDQQGDAPSQLESGDPGKSPMEHAEDKTDNEWQFATETTRQSISVDSPFLQREAHSVLMPAEEESHPHSLHHAGQATTTLNETIRSAPLGISEEVTSVLESPIHPGTPQIEEQSATLPLLSPTDNPAHPPSLQIGRRPTLVSSQRNRHFSVRGDTWTHVPLTPAGRSPGNPTRRSWSAEDWKAAGWKRAREE